jgi:hypothetical protein
MQLITHSHRNTSQTHEYERYSVEYLAVITVILSFSIN